MTLLYCDPCFLDHETGPDIERADRIREIPHRLETTGLGLRCTRPTWAPVGRRRLGRIHTGPYIDSVRAIAKSGGGDLEEETFCSPNSYEVALLAAGTVVDATERILRGEDRRALCLVRPPGHHALANRAMGFCIFNNVAIGAKTAIEELGVERVLIVDWDIHHGNGTQFTFWEDPRVGFLSIHRWPFYPGSGAKDEVGAGEGLGTTLNLPVAYGTPRADYLAAFRLGLEKMAQRMRPELIYVSAGFDTHRLDPIGDLGLETEDFTTLTRFVSDVSKVHAQGRIISVLEGGYDPPTLTDCVEVHLREMALTE